ncbi:hypothetical protein DW322_20430 [Rhodococcus rhodnii]|uniref:Uncharacterized protein n=2 Tax=Rhodococcus rhodnii TaxID=38312 RepID=R7WMP2_9NOCA|nr:dimethylamine monooxygenase subunit DmmA family protein [Rhodococcus rhodnii]EOM75259.1 hypothetical protein Rrhod_3394 [Rhodococcus rhodnii LMG 5362]TXG92102.1 hypothetical protein DW322_20430 [Rhodococcus rhodnii]
MSIEMPTPGAGHPVPPSPATAGGRCFTIASFGPEAYLPARVLADSLGTSPVDWLRLPGGWDRRSEDALRRVVARARVGWRLVVVGGEPEIRAAHALAVAGGAVPAEIVAHVVDGDHRQVYCAHCNSIAPLDPAAAGSRTRCPGCAQDAVAHPPVAPLHSAYLGVMPAGGV